MNRNGKTVGMIIAAVCFVAFILIAAIVSNVSKNASEDIASGKFHGSQKTLDELLERVDYTSATPVKASITLADTSLYDELPEIDKYPLIVDGHGQIDIEIFTSGEKAGSGNDSWLIDCADTFNRANYTTTNGETISLSVRSVSSGLAADYIISNKYLPDLYTPSNELFGEYAMANGGRLELYDSKLVGNTAGLLVKKDSEYKDVESILNAVMDGKINIGYTNPQTSATGLNLLIEILKTFGNNNVSSDTAADAFAKFNNNIPFVVTSMIIFYM